MADLSLEFCGIKFKHPIIIASLETTNSPEVIRECVDAGAAGMIVKTLTDIEDMARLTENSKYAILNERNEPIRGKVNKNFVFYSRSGYSSTGFREWVPHLIELNKYANDHGSHLIGSAGGKTVQSWVDICRTIEDAGLPMVELNFGCPHPAMMPGVHGGSMIGQEPEVAREVTARVCEAVDIPVVIKLTPDQSRVMDVARAVKEAGASAVTATNRYTGFSVDIETGNPRLGGPAGIGGVWAKPLSLRWVHKIYTELGMPVTGSNGIYDHRDVVEFIMTGAPLVQVGSILMLKGIKYLPSIIKGLDEFMDSHGYPDIESMTGIASKRSVKDYGDQFRKPRMHSEVAHDTCKNPSCTICIQTCFYDALAQGAGKVASIHANCIGCEMCTQTCPFDSTSMHSTTEADRDRETFFQIPDGVFEIGKFAKGFERGIKLSKVKG
ncbi:MAG: tRNA-dihydrouridine synthase [Burkholderiaceae bacterium]|jgi:dihydroorotate dehydrogenase (fumarate)/dihydropyrimidine dehydrogenase (NAD+) subunit PreA|nr:tRNA-dihydrouridine synthase [Burkholderiales bacterium]MCZ8097769.1 tRNA-dihydrouridine synthase [Burkholderiales bacterium]MCZ8339322.1 tRNA-dihydrouridine synthase [Burkholderiaceae bacterium]